MLFNLNTLKDDRKLVKRSLDKIYKFIDNGETGSLLTEIYFQLNTLNENIKDCKKLDIEKVLYDVNSISYDLRKLGHIYWNDKKTNRTIQKCIDDISMIYNKVSKYRILDPESNF